MPRPPREVRPDTRGMFYLVDADGPRRVSEEELADLPAHKLVGMFEDDRQLEAAAPWMPPGARHAAQRADETDGLRGGRTTRSPEL